MDRHQRRRAGGVHRDRRAVEVEEVGDTVGDDRCRGAGQRVRRGLVGPLAEAEGGHQLIVVGGSADEDADLPALEVAGRDVRVFQRFPGEFQCEPLLRVHHLDLARTHLEEVGVEGLHVVEVAAAQIALLEHLEHARIGLELRPAVRRQIGDAVASLDQRRPGGLRRGTRLGKAGGQPDDGDVVGRVALTPPVGVGVVVEPLIRVTLDDAFGQHRDGRMVVGGGRRQDHSGLVLDVGGQRHRIPRRQPELFHRAVVGDLRGRQPGRGGHPFTKPVTQFGDRQVACGLAVCARPARRLRRGVVGGVLGLVGIQFRHRFQTNDRGPWRLASSHLRER